MKSLLVSIDAHGAAAGVIMVSSGQRVMPYVLTITPWAYVTSGLWPNKDYVSGPGEICSLQGCTSGSRQNQELSPDENSGNPIMGCWLLPWMYTHESTFISWVLATMQEIQVELRALVRLFPGYYLEVNLQVQYITFSFSSVSCWFQEEMMRTDTEPFCRYHYTKMKDEWMDALCHGDLLARVCQGPAYDLRTTTKWTRKREHLRWFLVLYSQDSYLSYLWHLGSWYLELWYQNWGWNGLQLQHLHEVKWWVAGLLAEPMFLELLATTTSMETLCSRGQELLCQCCLLLMHLRLLFQDNVGRCFDLFICSIKSPRSHLTLLFLEWTLSWLAPPMCCG